MKNANTILATVFSESNFGSLDGVYLPKNEIMAVVFKALKAGSARLVCDSDETKSWELPRV